VVALSSLMAVLLQSLCSRLGIATGLDLAQACRRLLPRGWVIPLWLPAEVAIVACGLTLPVGVLVTAFDTVVLLGLQRFGAGARVRRWVSGPSASPFSIR
jgi:manganese transport protein